MPLQATHTRFALDLEKKLHIADIQAYISGTLYPDSRYLTGIERELTHDNKFLAKEFADSDFKIGWQVHQICDIAYNAALEEIFPELFSSAYDNDFDERWVASTSIKIILDMEDARVINIQNYIKYFDFVSNPNGESAAELKRHYSVVAGLYRDLEKLPEENLGVYLEMLALGPKAIFCEPVSNRVREFLGNKDILNRIESIYGAMIKSWPDAISKVL